MQCSLVTCPGAFGYLNLAENRQGMQMHMLYSGTLQKHKWENCMTIDRNSWGFRRNAAYADYLSIEELLGTLAPTVRYTTWALRNCLVPWHLLSGRLPEHWGSAWYLGTHCQVEYLSIEKLLGTLAPTVRYSAAECQELSISPFPEDHEINSSYSRNTRLIWIWLNFKYWQKCCVYCGKYR